jgi:hypothetical protein
MISGCQRDHLEAKYVPSQDTTIWRIDKDTLIVGGYGKMNDYGSYIWPSLAAPWFKKRNQIRYVRVEIGVTTVGDYAFHYMENLKNVELPISIETIEDGTFSHCTSLETVDLPPKLNRIGRGAFYSSGLKHIYIPDSVIRVEAHAFGNCEQLQSVRLSDNLTSISSALFYGCIRLDSVIIPDKVKIIGTFAFEDCKNLKYVHLPNTITSIHIGEYTPIGPFSGCESLTNITLPDSIDDIYAMDRCNGLQRIEVRPTNPRYTSVDGILFNKSGKGLLKFPEGRGGSYTIPDSVGIGVWSFVYCYDLNNINVRSSHPIYSSSGGILYNKNKSELVKFPPGRSSIVIPSGVDSIRHYAFYACNELTSVTIPKSLTKIGYNAFEKSPNIKTIINHNPVPQSMDPNMFDEEVEEGATLYVPRNSVAAYKASVGWGEFKIIRPI